MAYGGNWFAGLKIPLAASAWYQNLRDRHPPAVRMFHPDDIHLTIAFLGAMPSEHLPRIQEVLHTLRYQAFRIRFGALMALPSPHRVSALSLALTEGRETAAEIIARWRGAFYQAAHARPDTRPPLPHVTIARPNRKLGPHARNLALDWADGVLPPADTFYIDELCLYCWSEQRRERQFHIVECRALEPR